MSQTGASRGEIREDAAVREEEESWGGEGRKGDNDWIRGYRLDQQQSSQLEHADTS